MRKLKRSFFLISILSLYPCITDAQELKGQIVDSQGKTISEVAVVMQTIDSLFQKAVITNIEGKFLFTQRPNCDVRLLFQHVSYEPQSVLVKIKTANVGTIVLANHAHVLDEVSIVQERPIVKVEGSTLSFNMESVVKNKPLANAFDVVNEVPCIIGSESSISLMGANKLNIIINGKINSMTIEQIYSLLKTIPASRVEKVEVMYNAPSKYGVRGSLINIVLRTETGNALVGELGAKYLQSYYPSAEINGNLLYSTQKIKLDLLSSFSKGCTWNETNTFSYHTINQEASTIIQKNRKKTSFDDLNLRLGVDYSFNNNNSLSMYYYNSNRETNGDVKSNNHYEEDTLYDINSINHKDEKNKLHNVHAQYDANSDNGSFSIGMDFTNYKAPDDEHYTSYQEGITKKDFFYNSNQHINQWKIFSNKTCKISKLWTLNFGLSGGYNNSKTKIEYIFPQEDNTTESLNNSSNKQQEYIGRTYIESSNQLNDKLSMDIGLDFEYFQSDYIQNTMENSLWKEWTLYPKISMNYEISPKHILQFNVSSDKSYPSYWAVSPQTTYTDSYTKTIGNPSLKPSREYSGQLVYIYHQKYMLIAGVSYMPDYFALIPHQNKDELQTVYRYENYDFSLFTNVSAIIPFNIHNWWNGRISLHALRMQDKMSHFYQTSFNNQDYVGAIALNNTFMISKPNLSLQLNGRYQSPSIQGIYKLGPTYNLSTGLKYTLKNDTYILFQYDNILKRSYPNPMIINFTDQYSSRRSKELSTISIQFVCKIHNYKEKHHNKVDDSRFLRNE